MRIAAQYSFNNGLEEVTSRYANLLAEVNAAIKAVDANLCKTKESKEKTMRGRLLYSPRQLNKAFKAEFARFDWQTVRVTCDYDTTYYEPDYVPTVLNKGSFREMDFVKNKLGIEVQFGKYSFMICSIAAKMTIFRNLGHIDCGIEIVPVKALAAQMSSGVSYFEQFVWDLNNRGVSNIDIPVLILGIDV